MSEPVIRQGGIDPPATPRGFFALALPPVLVILVLLRGGGGVGPGRAQRQADGDEGIVEVPPGATATRNARRSRQEGIAAGEEAWSSLFSSPPLSYCPPPPRSSPTAPVVDDDDDHARRSLRRCGDDGEGGAPDPPDTPGVPRSADDATADNAAMVAVAVDDVTRHMTHIEMR